MSESSSPSTSKTPDTEADSPASASSKPGKQGGSPSKSLDKQSGGALHTEHGTTTIASSVVAKIAALATQEIPGVQAMGKSLSRTFGSIRAKVPGASQAGTQGVSVEVGERQAAVDIDIVVEYGHSIVEVAEAIRQNVIERIEGMTGLEVVEVNVGVDDLYLEGSDDDDEGSRVE
jgi:uncharacterized alkaline shock family protein YloU